MKVYSFGAENAPAVLLLPGTCCHWKGNFGAVIPLLSDSFRVLCVSYDGFDETESTEFPTMTEETEKIEAYIVERLGGHIRGAYGCSLGGSFVGLLAARQNIRMDYGILGSSDLDQSSPFAAGLQTKLLLPLIYPLIHDGQFRSRFLQKRLMKREAEMGGYVTAFIPPQRESIKDYRRITCEKGKYLAKQPPILRNEPTTSQKTMNQTVKTMHRIALVFAMGSCMKNAWKSTQTKRMQSCFFAMV